MTPTRPSVRDVMERTVHRPPVIWTWCHGCGQCFSLGGYVSHLQGLAEYERRAA